MPPRFPLEEFQTETLARWVQRPERGAPWPDNRAPTLVVNTTAQVGTQVTLQVRVDDADHDLVVGTLHVLIDGRPRVVGSVRSGSIEVTWDSRGVPPGSYPLTATLDDGAEARQVQLGTLEVVAP